MFLDHTFLVVESPEFAHDGVVETLESNGATVITKQIHDNTTNHVASHPITAIITRSIEFIEYDAAREAMIPIATPEWIYESLDERRILNHKAYNPDPKYFFKNCLVCVADNLPAGDKEVIYAGVRAFGGNYLDVLTKYTTHLIAVDMSNEKSIIASSAIGTDGNSINIKVVLPHWIDHCLTVGRQLDEAPYLLPHPSILHTESLTPDVNALISAENIPAVTDSDFFAGKKFFIAPDYNLSQRLDGSIRTLIESNGGHVSAGFDPSIDIYIGKYRNGDSFVESCRSERIIVGNLPWLYDIIVSKQWKLPTNSNLLHFPYPQQPLFKDINISVTNYSGDARSYLSKLITILGGHFTKTLTKDNDYLIVAKPEGKKYQTAKHKWLDSSSNPIVKVVNHLWIEECYAKWQVLDDSLSKYQHFGNGISLQLGRTKLDRAVLERWYEDEEKSEANIADSMSEDESTQKALETERQQLDEQEPETLTPPNTQQNGHKKELVQEEEQDLELETTPIPEENKENNTPRYGGRSAAKKAAQKLHDNMADLIKYQEISKSSRKMKTYMDELEKTATPVKRSHLPDVADSPIAKKKIKKADLDVVAIITGCESEITLSKADSASLLASGIKVLSDIPKHKIDTLIAPKILRTEKFLRSLGKVNRIAHPKYLVDVLAQLNEGPHETTVNIDDYSLDKMISIKEINKELGVKGPANGLTAILETDKRGILFEGMNFNLSSNLNGGVGVIANILKDNGMNSFQEVKNAAGLKKLLETEDNKILIAHKSKDTKLISAAKKVDGVVILDWDWCVKSIFKMAVEPFKDYRI